MQKSARPPLFVRLGNLVTSALLRRGVKMRTNTLLTVPGRKSGVPRTTPVTILELDGRRYVHRQEEHHRAGRLSAVLERTMMEDQSRLTQPSIRRAPM